MPGVPAEPADDADDFSAAERELLGRYLTNLDRRVFALRNLPEVVKGALFSRYSRTEKSLRRVLLDEFLSEPGAAIAAAAGQGPDDLVDVARGEDFYQRVLVGYGDDSVAELAGAHIAVEQVSNLAAKALEDSRIGIRSEEPPQGLARRVLERARGRHRRGSRPGSRRPGRRRQRRGLLPARPGRLRRRLSSRTGGRSYRGRAGLQPCRQGAGGLPDRHQI